MHVIDVRVVYRCAAYTTNRINGMTSSSTSCAAHAAARQAEKLFGPALQRVEKVDEQYQASLWRVTADADEFAWCWATGLIEFGDKVPEGACVFAKGPRRALRAAVEVAARHGIGASAGRLLVPGVPEAETEHAGMTALLDFIKWRAKGNGAKDSHGVVFATRFD